MTVSKRRPIRTNAGYFKALEEAERLRRIQKRQIRKIPPGLSEEAWALRMGEIDEGEVEKQIAALKERLIAYVGSLSEEKRLALKKSSRKEFHLYEVFWEYEESQEEQCFYQNQRPTPAQVRRRKIEAQRLTTLWMLDSVPWTTERLSEVKRRLEHATKFLEWAGHPASDEQEERARIEEFVGAVWNAQSAYREIRSLSAHETAVSRLRQKHFFPDLLELIGEARPEHHLPDGQLTTERKRQLLLIGLFEWRGMLLTYERLRPKNGWWGGYKSIFKWLVALSCEYPRARPFPTVADVLPQPLNYEWRDFSEVRKYWHISKESKASKGLQRIPRRVICQHCGNWFYADVTERLFIDGYWRRYCLGCGRTIRMAKALQQVEAAEKTPLNQRRKKKFWVD